MAWAGRFRLEPLAVLVLLLGALPDVAWADEVATADAVPLSARTSTGGVAEPVTGSSGATSPKSSASSAPPPSFVSSQDIGDKLAEAKQARESLIDFGVRDALARADAYVYEKTHIRFAAIYTVLYQHADSGRGPRDAAGGDFDLIGTWDALWRGHEPTGALEAAFEGRHRIAADITPSQLSQTIDSLWTTTSGFNEQPFSLIQVYWRQRLFDDRLKFRIGKLSGYSSFFGNRINSSSLFFVNYAFSDNPAVFFPGNGVGLHVIWEFAPGWTHAVGIQDANGTKRGLDPSTLRYGEFWYAAQVQYRTHLRGLGEGTIRVGAWYVDGRTPAGTDPGTGGVLSIDQQLGEHVIGFLRYEYQGEALLTPDVQYSALTGTEQSLRGGVGLPGIVPAWPDDFMGVGLAWGRPAQTRARDSYVGEIFYRSQIESAHQLTLSLQMIRSSTIYDQVFVLGVRLRIEL